MNILDSDAFLDMPQSAQNLYMHMAMRADDDGFIGNPKKIIRMIGAADDDYKLLVAKRFVLLFEGGLCVIKHWLIHNTIRKDRYEETVYKDEKRLLNIKENKAYTLGQPVGNQLATSGCHSIEENSIEQKSKGETSSPRLKDKENEDMWNAKSDDYDEGFVDLDGDGSLQEEKKTPTKKYPNAPVVRKLFQEIQGRDPASWKINKNQLQACENLYTERGIESIKKALLFHEEHKDKEYCPKISSPHDLDSKWIKLGEYKLSL